MVCDEQVALATEAFADCELILLPSKGIHAEALAKAGAEALVVRSTVEVDESLIGERPLAFVGTATVGSDHVDQAFLAERGIPFADAAGSSAASVTEFTWSLIFQAAARCGRASDFAPAAPGTKNGRRLAVVGVGAIGSRVARVGELLGFDVLRIDPPRAEREGESGFARSAALAEADIVSLHLPLTREGPHATHRLIDEAWLRRLRPNTLLVNTGRGAVMDSEAFIAAVAAGRLGGGALDVFPGEPAIDRALQRHCLLMTPHVAGRSLEGLVANTEALARAFRRMTGRPGAEEPKIVADLPTAGLMPTLERPDLAECLESVWGLEALDGELRLPEAGGDGRLSFSALRNRTPLRRDLASYRRRGDEPEGLRRLLDALAASTPCD